MAVVWLVSHSTSLQEEHQPVVTAAKLCNYIITSCTAAQKLLCPASWHRDRSVSKTSQPLVKSQHLVNYICKVETRRTIHSFYHCISSTCNFIWRITTSAEMWVDSKIINCEWYNITHLRSFAHLFWLLYDNFLQTTIISSLWSDSRTVPVWQRLRSPSFTSSASSPCDLPHIASCRESELGAATDYRQYATVYGITDISLSGSDVIQIRSQLGDPDTVEFGWSFFVDSKSLKDYFSRPKSF